MAQVMVNFRIDEEIKKNMEQACREMGLSMTTAFTIFAKKVGKEKRIPFEITAEPHRSKSNPPQYNLHDNPERSSVEEALARKRERLERLCAEIRRSLTSIHTAIPASITGLSMERIRLLCGDELKDKAAEASGFSRALASSRNAETLRGKDVHILEEYIDGLSSISEELLELEHTLIPAMKSRRGEDGGSFEPYEQRLAALSKKFDALSDIMQRFWSSTACNSGAHAVKGRIQRAARPVETAYVQTALENLEALILRSYDSLENAAKERLESEYLQTLELTLRELSRAEQEEGDVGGKAALCLRVINVLSQVVSDGQQARQEWSQRNLEAEVVALERLAAMRGDVAGGFKPG